MFANFWLRTKNDEQNNASLTLQKILIFINLILDQANKIAHSY